MYKEIKINSSLIGILRILDNAGIPFDEANTDYQAYLAWVAEGNTPLPVEETTA